MPENILGLVPDTWILSTLASLCDSTGGDIQTGPFGSQLHASDYVKDGIPSVMPQDIGDNVIKENFAARVSAEDARRLSRHLLREGDIVYSRRGDVERRALVRRSEAGWLCGTGCLRIRFGPGADPRFISYYLGHPGIRRWIVRHAVGATMPNLNTTILGAVPIVTPPLQEQQAIADVLSALDDKITINKRIARTTSELCRAIMQALWKQGNVASLTTESTTIDQGWRRTTLGALCAEGGGSIQTGPFGSQLHASDYVESGIPSVMPQNIGDNVILEEGISRITEADIDRLSKYQISEGDIIYSRRGDVKRRALVRSRETGWLCGTGCLRVRAGESMEPLLLSHYLGEPEAQQWIHRHAIGATMPNLNTAILGALPVVVPPAAVRASVNERLAALDARSIAAMSENNTLATLRDTLLPQLVTGKIRVKDARRVVEDATS
ncbi:restriction endonuclease subunit S [Kitasatospora cineracea]|uniref:restriction endonuclease subunit S n=1 Tax=Kitasatospora cineracea TaxID=88074 RepID=UPI00343B3204